MSIVRKFTVETPEHPSDKIMREAREASQATALNPGEAAILYDSLSPEEKDALTRKVLTSSKGATRVLYRNGELVEAIQQGVQRGKSSDQPEGIPAGLEKAHSPLGQAVNSWADVNEKTVLYIGGIQTQAGMAAKVGLISRLPDGSFGPPADPTAEDTAAKAAAEAAKAEADAPIETLTPELQEVVANLTEMVGSERKADSVVASVIAKGIGGDWNAAGAALARGTGQHPDQATENVSSAIQNAMESTAATLTARYGIDGGATLDHIASTMPAGDRAQLALALYRGDPRAFERCAEIGRRLARAKVNPLKH